MKSINILPIAFVTILSVLIFVNIKFSSKTLLFYGIAENKELDINFEHSVSVTNIYVEAGQRVSKGDIIMSVSRSAINVSRNDIIHDISKLESQNEIWTSSLKNDIRKLRSQRNERKNILKSQIQKLSSEMTINETLIRDIKSIEPITNYGGNNPQMIRLKGMQQDLKLSMRTYNIEINKIARDLKNTNNPIKIQIDKLTEELSFVDQEMDDLNIYSPSNGLIGSIYCKVGENIPAFRTFATMYEENPTNVQGYIIENVISDLVVGDSVNVQSAASLNNGVQGVITGLGSRIVEIPIRLRKNQNYLVYGREIQIHIPSENNFLQKEKVLIKIDLEPTSNPGSNKIVSSYND